MEECVRLHVDCTVDEEMQRYLTEHSEAHFVKHSDLAVDTVEIIISVAELAIAILALPKVIELIDHNKITVSFAGFEMRGNWRRIIRQICKNPGAKTIFIEAMQTNMLSVQGESRQVLAFYEEIKKAIDEDDQQAEMNDADKSK